MVQFSQKMISDVDATNHISFGDLCWIMDMT